jgi:hypothetical protein
MTKHSVDASCVGEYCTHFTDDMNMQCGEQASHKVGEEVLSDATPCHNLTAYVCCKHFAAIFGKVRFCEEEFVKTDKEAHEISGWRDELDFYAASFRAFPALHRNKVSSEDTSL